MNRTIRVLAFLVVLAVAVFAFIVSYSHIYDLGQANGQFGAAGRLLPLSIDGLIVAASLVLLEAALAGRDTPRLARAMLWAGVAATLGANAAYGRTWGLLGVLVSTLPAASFVGAVEMLFGMVRSAHAAEDEEEAEEAPVPQAAPAAPAPVATDAPMRHAGGRKRRATVKGGGPPPGSRSERCQGCGCGRHPDPGAPARP